jgi:creatinine amidohydrolase/Fe(II)-dependent formamide hydrolase-like protein
MPTEVFVRNLNSHQVGEAVKQGTILLLPIGQTEEHGQHLPIGTDAIIGEEAAVAAAKKMAGELPVLVAPPIQYGYSNEIMRKWPGTFIVRPQVMIDLIIDVCCSAVKMGFKKIAIVNSHGHHVGICRIAVRQVFDLVGVNVVITAPHAFGKEAFARARKSGPGGICHAGEYETSLLMHLGYPVDMGLATDADRLRFKSDFVATDGIGGTKAGSVFWSTWGLQKTESGALGDPMPATAETGKVTFEAIVEDYCDFIREFYAWQGPVE